MAEILTLRCHDSDVRQVSWHIQGGLQILQGEGSLDDAAPLARGRRTLVLIPGEETLITEVRIPTKNRQRLLQAAPYALETELTQDIEQLHFALGTSGEATPVIIVARDKLQAWLQRLESVGVEPVGLYPSLLCLPLPPEGWSLYLDQERLLVRTGPFQGFSADRLNGAEMLGLALQQAGESAPREISCYRLAGSDPLPGLETALDGCSIEEIRLDDPAQLTALLARELNEKQQINLLQGEFQRVDKLTLQWRRWMPAAILAAVTLLFSLTLNILDYYRYQGESAALDGRTRQLFQQAFPEIKRVIDPRQQMEQQLKAMRGGTSGGSAQFASLFAPAAGIIKESPNTTLEGISFRDGRLDLQLSIKELQALEALKKSIEKQRLAVEIRAANASGDKVSSQLRITGAGK